MMDFSRAFGALVLRAMFIAFVVGAVLALGGYLLIGWLIENLTILWG